MCRKGKEESIFVTCWLLWDVRLLFPFLDVNFYHSIAILFNPMITHYITLLNPRLISVFFYRWTEHPIIAALWPFISVRFIHFALIPWIKPNMHLIFRDSGKLFQFNPLSWCFWNWMKKMTEIADMKIELGALLSRDV